MRVMLDTNVLISMFLFPSEKMNRLKNDLCEYHQILLCSYVIDEMKDVVARKFPARENELDDFFQSYPFAMSYTPERFDKTAYPSIRDDFDLPVLASAILGDVDVLITGDKDFSDIDIEKPEILTPTEFIERYL
jgi:putative PIN family toxin of toxin-antitoxin system